MILKRHADDRYSEVAREWDGLTCVIIGGGPSLTFPDLRLVEQAREAGRIRCIAVNSAYLLAPWADVVYGADSHWHRWHTEGVAVPMLSLTAAQVRERFAGFAGQKCSIQGSGGNITDDAVHILKNKNGQRTGFGLSRDPGMLVDGRNSGFQALNLAILAGALKVLLLGFDGKPANDGRSHMLGPHPRETPEGAYQQYVEAMVRAESDVRALGVTVINCSPGSAIRVWPQMPLADAL